MYQKYVKRILDFFAALVLVIILSPLIAILAIIGLFVMKGNPFYLQQRPGLNESIFKLIKFRTMTNAKDADGNLLPDSIRLVPYGRALRRTSLDELPELINILKGDMSFVGPRPLLVKYLPYYTEREHKRHLTRPGLTGAAQVSGRNALAWDKRLELDVEYYENMSFKIDFDIICKTFLKVVKREDVVDAGSFEMLDLDQERISKSGIN